jgi:hypothetical protein
MIVYAPIDIDRCLAGRRNLGTGRRVMDFAAMWCWAPPPGCASPDPDSLWGGLVGAALSVIG